MVKVILGLAFVTLTLTLTFVPNARVNGELAVTSRLTATKGDAMAKLRCPRKDGSSELHSVLWLLHEKHILIGEDVEEYDQNKYRYLPSTGELLIQNVVYEDSGIYRCILRLQNGSAQATSASAVWLIVQRSYRNLWEEQYKQSLVRGLIAAGGAATLITTLCVIHKFRWRELNYKRYTWTELDLDLGVETGAGLGLGLDNPSLELEPHQQQYCEKFGEEEDGCGCGELENPLGNFTESTDNSGQAISASSLCTPLGLSSAPIMNPMAKFTAHITRI